MLLKIVWTWVYKKKILKQLLLQPSRKLTNYVAKIFSSLSHKINKDIMDKVAPLRILNDQSISPVTDLR